MLHKKQTARAIGGLFAAAILGLGALPAHADSDLIRGYVVGATGNIVRSGSGNCVKDGHWKPEYVRKECDADLWAQLHPAPAPMPKMEEPARPASFAVTETIDARTLFGFNRATLTPEATETLETLGQRLDRFESIQRVQVIGYTDRLGSDPYNQGLSERRAAAVADYLRNITRIAPDKIHERGMGEANPVASCENLGRRALIECLAPNRRVEIAITAERVEVTPGTR